MGQKDYDDLPCATNSANNQKTLNSQCKTTEQTKHNNAYKIKEQTQASQSANNVQFNLKRTESRAFSQFHFFHHEKKLCPCEIKKKKKKNITRLGNFINVMPYILFINTSSSLGLMNQCPSLSVIPSNVPRKAWPVGSPSFVPRWSYNRH